MDIVPVKFCLYDRWNCYNELGYTRLERSASTLSLTWSYYLTIVQTTLIVWINKLLLVNRRVSLRIHNIKSISCPNYNRDDFRMNVHTIIRSWFCLHSSISYQSDQWCVTSCNVSFETCKLNMEIALEQWTTNRKLSYPLVR